MSSHCLQSLLTIMKMLIQVSEHLVTIMTTVFTWLNAVTRVWPGDIIGDEY